MQTRVGASGGVTATLTDPDTRGADGNTVTITPTWEWSIPKVSRPILDNDDHWTDAGGTTNGVSYEPVAGAADSLLRVKATYTDGTGTTMRTAYAKSAYVVVAALGEDSQGNQITNKDPAFGTDVTTSFDVAEDAAIGTVVGTVRGSDTDSADILSHELTDGGDNDSFKIDIATGEITVNGMLDHEDGSANDDGVYAITVNAYDPSNGTGNRTVTITATNVNEKPSVGLVGVTTETTEVREDLMDDQGDALANEALLGSYTPSDVDVADGDEPPPQTRVRWS